MAFVMLVQLYTSRVILYQLGQEGYGLYNVVGGLVVVLTFLNGAMIATSQRFIAYELGRKDHERLRLTFSQSFYAHILIAFVFIIAAETVGLWFLNTKMVIEPSLITAANWVYQFSVASFIISLIQVPFGALITAHERMDVYAILGIVDVVLRLGVACSIAYFAESVRLEYYAILIFLVTLIINLSYVIFCRLKYQESRLVKRIDNKIFKSMTYFLGWSIFGSLAWVGKNQGVNIVLNTFLGTVVNAAYGVAMQINGAINTFAQNFISALNPQVIQSYAAKNLNRTVMLVLTGSKISFLLLFLIVFPVFVTIEHILSIWLVDVPEYSAIFLKLVMIITLLESFAYVMGTAIQATGKIRLYQILVGCTLLLNLPAAYILLRLNFPPYAVFYAGILIAVTTLVERVLILSAYIPPFHSSDFLRKTFVPSLMTALVSSLTYCGLTSSLNIHNWIIQLILAFALALICEFIFATDKGERQKIYTFSKNIWIKLKSYS